MTHLKIVLSIMVVMALSGCAEIQPLDTPAEVLKHPFGTDPINIGMTKQEVEALWGRPDQTRMVGTDQWGTPKEEWIYRSRYSKIPIDRSYIYKSKYLYFDGNILTGFGDQPKEEKPASQE